MICKLPESSISQSIMIFRVAWVIVITARTSKNVNYRRMSGKERRNRKVFRRCWNDCRVDALTVYSGSEFQMEEAAAGKARLLMNWLLLLNVSEQKCAKLKCRKFSVSQNREIKVNRNWSVYGNLWKIGQLNKAVLINALLLGHILKEQKN